DRVCDRADEAGIVARTFSGGILERKVPVAWPPSRGRRINLRALPPHIAISLAKRCDTELPPRSQVWLQPANEGGQGRRSGILNKFAKLPQRRMVSARLLTTLGEDRFGMVGEDLRQ